MKKTDLAHFKTATEVIFENKATEEFNKKFKLDMSKVSSGLITSIVSEKEKTTERNSEQDFMNPVIYAAAFELAERLAKNTKIKKEATLSPMDEEDSRKPVSGILEEIEQYEKNKEKDAQNLQNTTSTFKIRKNNPLERLNLSQSSEERSERNSNEFQRRVANTEQNPQKRIEVEPKQSFLKSYLEELENRTLAHESVRL